MDRFIVTESQMLETTLPILKSNMDRFIEKRLLTIVLNTEF